MFEIIGMILIILLSLGAVIYSLFIFYALLILNALGQSSGVYETIVALVLILIGSCGLYSVFSSINITIN